MLGQREWGLASFSFKLKLQRLNVAYSSHEVSKLALLSFLSISVSVPPACLMNILQLFWKTESASPHFQKHKDSQEHKRVFSQELLLLFLLQISQNTWTIKVKKMIEKRDWDQTQNIFLFLWLHLFWLAFAKSYPMSTLICKNLRSLDPVIH